MGNELTGEEALVLAKKYARDKVTEAGGMTSEGVVDIVIENIDEAVENAKAFSNVADSVNNLKQDLASLLPTYTSADNGKILGVVNGKLAWVVVEVSDDIPDEPNDNIDGTWQLRTSTSKRYIILSTDDDNEGNAKWLRMLRSYGFPYTMNVEAENLKPTRNMGNDIDEKFSSSDAPSVFNTGVNLIDLAKYIIDNNLGEITQHGASDKTLWDSAKLTDTVMNNLYQSYTSQGGTKSKSELREAIISQMADTDSSQNASYVLTSRKNIESIIDYPINAIAMWGGSPTAHIDDIDINLNAIKGAGNYDFKANGYKFVAPAVEVPYKPTHDLFSKYRKYYTADVQSVIDNLAVGDVIDLFAHMPFNDLGWDNLRTMLDTIKANVDSGKVEVITPSRYVELGEYVSNPIVSIKLSNDNAYSVGSNISDNDFKCTVTYKDGTKDTCKSDRIIVNDVNTSVAGTYNCTLYYRGFEDTITIEVTSTDISYPDCDISEPRAELLITLDEDMSAGIPKYLYVVCNTDGAPLTIIPNYNYGTQILLRGLTNYKMYSSYNGNEWEVFSEGTRSNKEYPIKYNGGSNLPSSYYVSHRFIKNIEVTETSITLTKDTTTYFVGETASKSDCKVILNYSDGTTQDVTNSSTISGTINTSAIGEYTLTATYKTFTSQITVKVMNANAQKTAPSWTSGYDKSPFYFTNVANSQHIIAYSSMSSENADKTPQDSGGAYKSTGCTTAKWECWDSVDGGYTWTLIETNSTKYSTVSYFDGSNKLNTSEWTVSTTI